MTVSLFPADNNISFSSLRYEPRFQTDPKSNDFDLTSGLRLIRRRIAMIVALVALLMAAAVTQISGLKPTYHAESRLMINSPLATRLSGEDSGRTDPLQLTSETERLLSRSVAEQVIRDLHLDQRPEFNPTLRKPSLFGKAREMFRGLINSEKPSLSTQNSIEPVIPEYYRALRVWRDGQNDVIQIGFDAGDPELAAAAPNRLISVYLEQRKNSIRARLNAAEAWIRQRVVEQQGRTKSAREAADQYRKTWGIMANNDAQDEQAKTITELRDRLSKIEESRSEVRSLISNLDSSHDISFILQNTFIPESIGAMARDLRNRQQNLDRLLRTYSSNSDAVVDLRAEILKSRTDFGLAVNRYLQSMRVRLAALDREHDVARSALAAAREQLSRSDLVQAESVRLQHIADYEQTALDKLDEQRRALAAQAMLPGAEIEVLSPAAIPLLPEGRGRLFYLIGALLASVSIAITAAFAIEMLDKSVRSFDQIAGMAGVAAAGLIPRLRRKDRRNPSMLHGELFREAIRTVMISLRQSSGGKLPDSIVVTSARSGEGKSLVARALAVELVANGSSVLLVDGDFSHGNLDTYFKSGLKHGLNEFLGGRAALRDIIHHHLPSGVDFIPAGTPSLHRRPNLADVTEIISVARSRGQIVIFDSAPVLASSDTLYMTGITERTLMVIQWAKTRRRTIQVGVQHLKRFCKGEVFVALNKVEPKTQVLYDFSDSEFFMKSLTKRRSVGEL
jgi:uncharacterized protein involved in exopolysaccharide biosynthesis/Mrp family chromosome partitioning ATPase